MDPQNPFKKKKNDNTDSNSLSAHENRLEQMTFEGQTSEDLNRCHLSFTEILKSYKQGEH